MGQRRIANRCCGSWAKNNLGCSTPWTRNNKQGEGGNEGGDAILHCSDPKSNGESKNKHWLTPVPLNKYAKSLNNSQLI